jgi:ELWxxDGT repeat protein
MVLVWSVATLLWVAAAAPVAAGRPPRLVANIQPGYGSYPADFVESSGTVYFTASDPEHGREVWRTDGTPGGTVLVADIDPGPEGSDPSGLVAYQDGILFTAYDGQDEAMWRADGGRDGAMPVARTSAAAMVSGDQIFAAQDTPSGMRLMRIDPRTGALEPVGDIGAGVHTIGRWFDVEGTLYFTVDRAHQARTELWASDGTDGGTRSLGRIGDRGEELTDHWPIEWMGHFTGLGSTLFFIRAWASGADCGLDRAGDLWVSDGTRRGTRRAAEGIGRIGRCISDVTRVGDRVFFTSYRRDPKSRVELWVTDGTRAGTFVLASFRRHWADQLTAFGDRLLFEAGEDDMSGLWSSDGTADGTRSVGRFPRKASGGLATGPGERAYFLSDGLLWVTDGTAAGTALVADFGWEVEVSDPVRLGSAIVFAHDDGASGREPWVSDGTTEGTRMLRDIDPTDDGSDPAWLTPADDSLYLVARGATPGWREHQGIWAIEAFGESGEPTAGPAFEDAMSPDWLTVLGGDIVFTARHMSGRHGIEPWSDAQGPRVREVRDIRRGRRGSTPSDMVVMGRRVFFAATSNTGRDLWATDGTRAGTIKVHDLAAGAAGAPRDLVVAGDRLYFTSGEEAHGRELWITDGSAGGTRRVADIRPGGRGSSIAGLTAVGDRVFFRADEGVHGAELWTSDGTAAGTHLVRDLRTTGGSAPRELTAVGERLYFTAADDESGTRSRLWSTDGTAAGTRPVGSAPECAESIADPADLLDNHGTLYFVATCGEDRELYRTGETFEDPAAMVADVRPDESSEPDILASVYGRLYFSADDGVHGRELWSTDGTREGTTFLGDINRGASSDPAEVVAFWQEVYFTADDGVHGREVWSLRP